MSDFTNHTDNFWNKRYGDSDYVYGTDPNQFLQEQAALISPGMKALVVGDGEGRNGVWLASKGLEVLSVDLSAMGLKKAKQLAQQQQVELETQCIDLTSWEWPIQTYDLVVSIYVHFDPSVRAQMHQAMLRAIKPDGIVIIEAFNVEQLQYQQKYNSGGPPKKEMLYTSAMLQTDFAASNIVHLQETVTLLKEGKYHEGQASVVRLIARAPKTHQP